MPFRSDDVPLWDLERALRQLAELVDQHTQESFLADEVAVAAAAMYLLVIGESAHKLSADARAGFDDVPWDDVISLRHRLAHGYFRQNPERIWEAAVNSAPILYRQLPALPPPPPRRED